MSKTKNNHTATLIAEIGQAHDGSLGILHSYIDALAETGVDAIKFQTHIAEAESSVLEPFRINFSYEDKTRFDYWKRMSFTPEQWVEIKAHCDEKGLEFISSP
ncbi:MAG: N-acetylneuraminate synthase family protein, partial [Bacteroidota bacterium]